MADNVPANLHNNEALLELLQQLTENGENGNEFSLQSNSVRKTAENRSETPRSSTSTITKMQNSVPNANQAEFQGLPDQAEILDRLSRIREHKRQVLDMMDKLKKNGEEVIDKDTLRKLINAYDNFKEQEEQYLSVLQKILTLKQSYASAMEESGFQSDVQSEASENIFQTARPVDVVNGNERPMIEDKVGFMLEQPEHRMIGRANMNGNDGEGSTDELQALIEQRNMLKKMLRQQEELRALQGRHAAQQGQKEVEPTSQQRQQTLTREKEYMATRQQVDDQAASLASKRRELEDLKEKLDAVKSLYGENSSSEVEYVDDDDVVVAAGRQREMEDKLRLLKGKKIRMDDILNQLSDFQAQNPSLDEFVIPTTNVIVPRNQQRVVVDENNAAVDNKMILQQKYQELLATKKRIADVKKLMAQMEEECAQAESTPTPSSQQQQHAQRVDVAPIRIPDMNQQMRSAYESKINEQQQAIASLQGEHERLMGIKNQLMTLNDEQLRHLASRGSTGVVDRTTNEPVLRSNDEVWRELRQQAIQREEINSGSRQTRGSAQQQLLNNTKDNASDHSFASRGRNVRGSVAATHGSQIQEDDYDDDAVVAVYRNNNNSSSLNVNNSNNNNLDAGGIVSNPLLASFRRNNDIQDNNSPCRNQTAQSTNQQQRSNVAIATPSGGNKQRRRADVNANSMELQYDQLQQHIDSIRSIFETLMMKERTGSVVAPTTNEMPANLLQSLIAASTSINNPSTFAVQQQQLTISLLSCQQQLQLQQMEMRYLQQLCHDLMNFNQLQRSPMSEPPPDMQVGGHQHPSRSRSASFAQASAIHPVAAVVPPLDGRPLSSGSLYNLLAPNPYLTFPYYPLPQMQPNIIGAGPKNVLNNSFAMNNAASRGFNRSPMVAPPPTATSHPHRHQSAMEQSHFSDCSDRSATTNVKATASANESPSKYVRSSTTTVGVVPKLELDSLCKSNVAKKQKNFDNTQQNEIVADAASMSRVSSVASAIANGAYGGQDGNYNVDQFDALREMIYSEVATLISQNEQRPHFLLELFRELQLLSSDHLRSRALFAIRDVLNRFLTDDTDGNETDFDYRNVAPNAHPRTVVEETQTDSAWTSDDEAFKQKRTFVPVSSRDKAHDFSETACSGSTVSTPEQQTNAFVTADGLNQTVIHYEKPQTVRPKRFENLEDIKDVKNAPLNNAKRSTTTTLTTSSTISIEKIDVKRIQNRDFVISTELANKNSNVDVAGLERDIQTIVDELIPFLRDNADTSCTPQLLQYLRKFVLTLTNAKLNSPTSAAAAAESTTPTSETPMFSRQLAAILDESLNKFKGYKLHECCEEIVADISEVIFNELAYYRLMQNIDSPGGNGEKTSNLNGAKTTNANVSISLLEQDFPHIDDDGSNNAQNVDGEKSKTASNGDEASSAGHFLTRTPSDSRETTPYEELREVEDTLDYIDDDFQSASTARESGVVEKQDTLDGDSFHDACESRAADEVDIDRDEMSAATDNNSIRNSVQNGPTNSNLAQLCDAE